VNLGVTPDGVGTEEMRVMFMESAAMAEVEYRQRRFLEEVQAYRLAKLARSAAPARRPRMGATLAQLRTGSAGRGGSADRADHTGSADRAA